MVCVGFLCTEIDDGVLALCLLAAGEQPFIDLDVPYVSAISKVSMALCGLMESGQRSCAYQHKTKKSQQRRTKSRMDRGSIFLEPRIITPVWVQTW